MFNNTFINNLKDISQSLINSPITGQEENEQHQPLSQQRKLSQQQQRDILNESSSRSDNNQSRPSKYAPEVLVIVRPPPHISNNPMNLQIQLVTPKSNRQSVASDKSLSRSSSIHSEHSLGQASNVSLHSTTSHLTSGGRKLIPLYNLQYHNVLTTTISDAGTDAKIAKFTKRGMEILSLINLESQVTLGDNTSVTTKKFSFDNLFKFNKSSSSSNSTKTGHLDEYVWSIKKFKDVNDVNIDDLHFQWQRKQSNSNKQQQSRSSSAPSSAPGSVTSDVDPEDDETPWSFFALSNHFDKPLHLGTLHPAPHHPRIVGQLKVPYPLSEIQIPNLNIKLTSEDLKDILSCTCLWLVIKEEFGGLDKRRKGDGWRIT